MIGTHKVYRRVRNRKRKLSGMVVTTRPQELSEKDEKEFEEQLEPQRGRGDKKNQGK